MGKSVTAAANYLSLILNAVAIPGIADNAAAGTLNNLYLSLHTADPTAAGNQGSSEVAYVGYTRVALARSPTSPAWTISTSGNVAHANPNSPIDFPNGAAGPTPTALFAAVGTAAAGPGMILSSGALASAIVCGNNVQPRLGTGSIFTET